MDLTWYQWLGVVAAIVTIFSTGGAVSVAFYRSKLKPKPFDRLVVSDFTYRDVVAGVEKLVDHAKGAEPDEIDGSGADGLAAQKVLAAAIESIKTGQAVEVNA